MRKAPTRPALRYYGGKWLLAPWIISHFPPHKNYIEPCGGGGSVLLQKDRSRLEVYNDLDRSVVNFFRVLREEPEELTRLISLTPWARSEYELSMTTCDDCNSLEKARRFFVRSWMSYNGATGDNPRSYGWRYSRDSRSRLPAPNDIINHSLLEVAARFQGVQIENRDYKQVITCFDNDRALIYMDPPYLPEGTQRLNKHWYAHDWDVSDHEEAAKLLRGCSGLVIISGYKSELYQDLYESKGWARVDTLAQSNAGKNRTESLWLSPQTSAALKKPRQLSMFTPG